MSAVICARFTFSCRYLQREINRRSVDPIIFHRTRGHSRNKFAPLLKCQKVWSATDMLKIVSQAPPAVNKASGHQKVLDLCQQLQDLGYEFSEVSSHWQEVAQYNVWEIIWASHSLLAKHTPLTAENLLNGLQAPALPYPSDKTLSLQMTRHQCIGVLTELLMACGAIEESVTELRDKFYSYEISENRFVQECSYAICITRLLMAYLNTSPDSIISEYNCLARIDLALLLEQWQDILAFGINLPYEVVNYTTGAYMKPALRGAKSYATGEVLKLVGLSKAEADDIGFTKEVILHMLHSLNLDTIENTYVYLLNTGYTKKDIAQVPFILAFSSSQIKELLEENPKAFKQATNKASRLRLIGKSLCELYNHAMAKHFE